MASFIIRGLAIAQADRKITSAQLDEELGLKSGYIAKRSGVQHRFYLNAKTSQSEFAATAVKQALKQAHLRKSDLDLLISTSAVPEQAIPGTACFVAHHLGLSKGTPAFDINASCLGFLVSLFTAINLLETQAYKRIAVVASDLASRGLNWNDLHSAPIFGDGAAAIIIESATQAVNSEGKIANCLAYLFETYAEGRHFCEIKAGGTRINSTTEMTETDFQFSMDGKAVFKIAMQKLEKFIEKLLAQANLTHQDIDCVVLHQASHLGMEHAIHRMKFKPDTIVNIYSEHGNQVSASIPTTLFYADQQGKLAKGNKVLLLGTAAGFSIGGMILGL